MEYAIVAAVIVIFAIIVFVGIKKTNARKEERMKLLTEEQKTFLQTVGYKKYGDSGKYAVTSAVLTSIKDMNKEKTPVDFIFWNGSQNRLEIGDGKMSVKAIKERNLSVGDTIELVLVLENGGIAGLKEIL